MVISNLVETDAKSLDSSRADRDWFSPIHDNYERALASVTNLERPGVGVFQVN